jgi:hypothetical protein
LKPVAASYADANFQERSLGAILHHCRYPPTCVSTRPNSEGLGSSYSWWRSSMASAVSDVVITRPDGNQCEDKERCHFHTRPSPLRPDLSGDARHGRNVTSSRQAGVRSLRARWCVFGVSMSAGLQDKTSAMTSDCANPDLTGPRMISIPCVQCWSRHAPRFETPAASAAPSFAIGVPSTNIYNCSAGVGATRAQESLPGRPGRENKATGRLFGAWAPGTPPSGRGSPPSRSAWTQLARQQPKLRAIARRISRS